MVATGWFWGVLVLCLPGLTRADAKTCVRFLTKFSLISSLANKHILIAEQFGKPFFGQYEPDDSNHLISYVWNIVPGTLAWSWLRASRCTLWIKTTKRFVYGVVITCPSLNFPPFFSGSMVVALITQAPELFIFWKGSIPYVPHPQKPSALEVWWCAKIHEPKLLFCAKLQPKLTLIFIITKSTCYFQLLCYIQKLAETPTVWYQVGKVSACFRCKPILILEMSHKQLYVGFVLQTPGLF